MSTPHSQSSCARLFLAALWCPEFPAGILNTSRCRLLRPPSLARIPCRCCADDKIRSWGGGRGGLCRRECAPGRRRQGLAAQNGFMTRDDSVVIEIDGSSLTCAQVAAVARGGAQLRVAPAAVAAARAAWQVA